MLQPHRLNSFITRDQGSTDLHSNSFPLPVGMTSNNLPGLPTDSSPDPFYSTSRLDFGQEGKIRESPLSTTNEAIPPILGSEKLVPKAKASRRKWKKPKDKPKRPLSAYNIFFQHERLNMMTPIPSDSPDPDSGNEKPEGTTETTIDGLKTKSKSRGGGFAGLTRQIAAKWNSLDPETRSVYEVEAKKEQLRYAKALEEWKQKKSKQRIEEEELKLKASLFSSSDEANYYYGGTSMEQNYAEADSLHAATMSASTQQERRNSGSPNRSISNDYSAPRFLPLHYAEHDSQDDWTAFRFGTHQMNPPSHPLPILDTHYGATYFSDTIFEPATWQGPVKTYNHSESLMLLFDQLDEEEQQLLLNFRRGR